MSYEHELKKLGRKIAKLRGSLSISQDELAHLSNNHRTSIERIELGQQEPKLSTLLRISKVFKISISELLSDL